MKKYYSIVLIILICFSLSGQEKQNNKITIDSCKQVRTKVFELDLGLPHERSLMPICVEKGFQGLMIKSKQLLAFNLINTNPYKYDYIIENELVDFFEEDKKEFYEIIEKARYTIKDENKATNGEDGTNGVVNMENTVSEEIEMFEKEREQEQNELATLENEYEELKKDMESPNSINGIEADGRERVILNDYESLIASKKEIINKLNRDLNEISKKYNNNRIRISQQRIELQNLKNELEKGRSKFEQKKKLKEARGEVVLIFQKLKILEKKIKKYLTRISSEEYINKEKFINLIEKYDIEYNNLVEQLNKNTSEYELQLLPQKIKIYNDFIENNIKESASRITNLLSEMHALKFDHYVEPLDFNGENIDVVKIMIKRVPKHGNIRTPKEYSYNIWVKGGLKIDVSAGLFITNLVDKDYSLTKISDATETELAKSVINENNQGDFRYGFGSLVHTSFRNSRWVRPSLSFGAVFIGDQNPKVQLLTGVGLVLGKKQRIIINYGLAMGSVSKLSNGLLADGTTEYEFTSDDTIPKTERFSFGQFFGITYNLSKVKTQKDAKE
nr:hypothetical protein [uncultured Allomuricauda sp.]